jgi:hypothetical protein
MAGASIGTAVQLEAHASDPPHKLWSPPAAIDIGMLSYRLKGTLPK